MSQSKILHIESNLDKNKGITIDISNDPKVAAGKHISDILAINAGRPILFLVAGGSAQAVLDYINSEYLDDKLTVTVTDERFTDDIFENNFDNLQASSFYNELVQVGAFCINTSMRVDDTLESMASRFEKDIKSWKDDYPKGIIIGLYGIGADGHIGGIIPGIYHGEEFDKKFLGDTSVETVIDLPESKFPYRFSTTLSFMKKIDFPVIYLTGENKKAALEKALDKDTIITDIPARIVLEMKSPTIFTDINIL